MLKQLILVGLGGGIGGILRYLTSVTTAKFFTGGFPLATFIANIVGCAILGVCLGAFSKNIVENESLKLLLITGFCGGGVHHFFYLCYREHLFLAATKLCSFSDLHATKPGCGIFCGICWLKRS